MNNETRDKKGRMIQKYDVLKVYHFTGSRNKKYYMYKHVIEDKAINGNYFTVSSLSRDNHTYSLGMYLGICNDIEIVQGEGLDEREALKDE
jgi:hypothetical protein